MAKKFNEKFKNAHKEKLALEQVAPTSVFMTEVDKLLESSKKNRDLLANQFEGEEPQASSPLFVKRNHNIAPYYREYTSNKQRLINLMD